MLIGHLLATEMAGRWKMSYAATSMKVSRPSRGSLDPLSDVLMALGAQSTRRTRLEAAGRWGLSFESADRLKFVTLLRGAFWIAVPGCPPRLMKEGDVCLLGRTAYSILSHETEIPRDGSELYSDSDMARIGGADTVSMGGTVTFDPGKADFLFNMLPAFMIVPRATPPADAVARILTMIGSEIDGVIGSGIVAARLADVLLVEGIRACAARDDVSDVGWLAALSDVRIGRALRAIHVEVSRSWTVAELAGVAGMSRAAFSAEFTRLVGQPPLGYIRTWRLSLAEAALTRGDASVASIAYDVGYASQSAFGHAFRRAYGRAPRAGIRLAKRRPAD